MQVKGALYPVLIRHQEAPVSCGWSLSARWMQARKAWAQRRYPVQTRRLPYNFAKGSLLKLVRRGCCRSHLDRRHILDGIITTKHDCPTAQARQTQCVFLRAATRLLAASD